MTRFEEFAKAAMEALLSHPNYPIRELKTDSERLQALVCDSIEIADAFEQAFDRLEAAKNPVDSDGKT